MDNTEFTKYLIKELGETEDRIKLLLLFIVKELGQEKCLELLATAKERKSQGELTRDGSRERTFGGCFFNAAEQQTVDRARKNTRKLLKAMKEKTDNNGVKE